MKCPVCNEPELLMSERQGIEVDYCPKCRGVWLDRGELDKLIERSQVGSPEPDSRRYGDDDDQHRRASYPRKRKGLLGEIFDFD